MIRRIIQIDEEKCNGCGLCAQACHEGAISMVDGKAKLLREDYCDGLGDCLPACPTGAITFENREAPAYNQEAVKAAQAAKKAAWAIRGFAALRMSGNAVGKKFTIRSRRYFPRNFMLRKVSFPNGRFKLSLYPFPRHTLTMRTFWWRLTVPLMPMVIFIRNLSKIKSKSCKNKKLPGSHRAADTIS